MKVVDKQLEHKSCTLECRGLSHACKDCTKRALKTGNDISLI